jgi:hypothetical protein
MKRTAQTKCKGGALWFPDARFNNTSGALCQVHATEVYGQEEIQRLINLRVITSWSTANNQDEQLWKEV